MRTILSGNNQSQPFAFFLFRTTRCADGGLQSLINPDRFRAYRFFEFFGVSELFKILEFFEVFKLFGSFV